MKKIKKMLISLFVVFMIGGVFNPDVAFATSTSKPSGSGGTVVKEENTPTKNTYNDIPGISMEGGKLNLDTIDIGTEQKGNFFNKVLTEYRGIVTFISGIGLVSMILFFIVNLIALGNSKGNPQERQKAITGLIVSGVATAGLGSVTLITTLFYHAISNEAQ